MPSLFLLILAPERGVSGFRDQGFPPPPCVTLGTPKEVVGKAMLCSEASGSVCGSSLPGTPAACLTLARPIGNEDVAVFLLSHGASFCSYVLLDSPGPSKRLLRKYFIEPSGLPSNCPGKVVSAGAQRAP